MKPYNSWPYQYRIETPGGVGLWISLTRFDLNEEISA